MMCDVLCRLGIVLNSGIIIRLFFVLWFGMLSVFLSRFVFFCSSSILMRLLMVFVCEMM